MANNNISVKFQKNTNSNNPNLLGWCSISFEGLASIQGINLRAKKTPAGSTVPGDMYISFRQRAVKAQDGTTKYYDYCGPMNKETRSHIQDRAESALITAVFENQFEEFSQDEFFRILWIPNQPDNAPTDEDGNAFIMSSERGSYGLARANVLGHWFVNNVELWQTKAGGAYLKYPGEDAKDKQGNPVKNKNGYPIRNVWLQPATKELREAIEDAVADAYEAENQ